MTFPLDAALSADAAGFGGYSGGGGGALAMSLPFALDTGAAVVPLDTSLHRARRDVEEEEGRAADADMEHQNVIVSVRVRPINERERAMGASAVVVSMEGARTTIVHPERDRRHVFSYDHSFWSCQEDSPAFATQQLIFDRLGRPLLRRALEGYNCCLFAYGQTGSGKSYSMMGDRAVEVRLRVLRVCLGVFFPL